MKSSDLSRFDFIASTSAALTSTATPDPTTKASSSAALKFSHVSGAVPFQFDRVAFQSLLELPYPHRQLAAPASYVDATIAMSHFENSLAAYADPNGFAGGPKSLHCAAVLYAGRSYVMVLDDSMFAKYHIGSLADEEMRPNDLSNRAYWTALRHNPMAEFLRPLIDRGITFFVCNNALSGLAVELARLGATNGVPVTREAVVAIHDELADHFLPGTMLVPAGVAAVNAAQEARFTFLP